MEGTALTENTQAIRLAASTSGEYAASGDYLSPAVPLHGKPVLVRWIERWTTPLAWERDPANPVVGAPEANDWDQGHVTTPSLLSDGRRVYLYYGSRPQGTTTAVGLATAPIDDLNNWEKNATPILRAGSADAFDARGVIGPEVVPVTDSHWHMYYVGYHPTEQRGTMPVHQIGLAESDDAGVTWRHTSNDPIIPHGPPGSYDAFAASSCSVLRVGDRWMMWYGGIQQVPYLAGVCLATSDDGHRWTKWERNPVLSFNPYLRDEAFLVAAPHVLHEDGLFKMWYSAKGFGPDGKAGDYRVCYAESRDGILWERYAGNPMLGPAPEGWDHQMAAYPEVLRLGDEYHMWYCGDGYKAIGHAVGRSLASVRVETRLGNGKPSAISWNPWSGPCAKPSGSRVESSGADWLQVRLHLETKAAELSPAVENLAIFEKP